VTGRAATDRAATFPHLLVAFSAATSREKSSNQMGMARAQQFGHTGTFVGLANRVRPPIPGYTAGLSWRVQPGKAVPVPVPLFLGRRRSRGHVLADTTR